MYLLLLQNLTLRRLPGLTDWITRLGGSPYLLSKHGNIKMRDCVVGWVSPPKGVISPTWGPLLPCKCTRLTFIGESGAFRVFRGARYREVLIFKSGMY